jgi:hypothetical protein
MNIQSDHIGEETLVVTNSTKIHYIRRMILVRQGPNGDYFYNFEY